MPLLLLLRLPLLALLCRGREQGDALARDAADLRALGVRHLDQLLQRGGRVGVALLDGIECIVAQLVRETLSQRLLRSVSGQ